MKEDVSLESRVESVKELMEDQHQNTKEEIVE